MSISNNILKRNTIITFAIILIIFSVGFILRIESVHISGISDNEKAFFEDQNGFPYMYELDSYYNYRLTKNYIDHGYLGDAIIDGKEWDLHSYYHPGVPLDYPPLIVYITAFIYKLVNLFAGMPLIMVCFWLPAFIGPLAGVVAYLFVRKFTNEYGAAAAGILMATAPFYFIRTVPGWFDTDMFNIIFPILVVWFFFEAIQSKTTKKMTFFTSLSIISMLLFAMAWNGWQYQFYLIVIFSVFYVIWNKLRGRQIKNLLYVLGGFFTGTLLLVAIFTGYLNVIKLFASPLELFKMVGSQGLWSPWPDIYISVSELASPTVEHVVSSVGIAFFGGIFGFLWIFRVLINKNLKKRFLNKMSCVFFSFLILWTIVGFFALTEGSRFILMIIPPLVLSTGIMAGLCISYLDLLRNSTKISFFKNSRNITIISSVILLLFVTPAIANVYASFSGFTPGTNDDLWTASEWINNNTPNDTVIISEWSYGHLFTSIADRPVVFDGRLGYIETLPIRNYDNAYTFRDKSPSVSREYWIYRAFETGNERLSSGIFKMIATSGDLGYLTLDNYTKNTTKTVEILNSILGLNKEEAMAIMTHNYSLNAQEAQSVLNYTHPDNPQSFVLVTTDDMINSGYWVFYFGLWDFNKIEGNDNLTYSVGKISINNDILNSSDGILMNLNTGNIIWDGKTPYSSIIINKSKVKKHYLDKNSDFSVILNMDSNKSVIIDKNFENSLFTKLVIEKNPSTNFKSIHKNNDVTVWKIT